MLEDLQEAQVRVLCFHVVRGQAGIGYETRDGETGDLLRGLGVLFPEDWKEYSPRPSNSQPVDDGGLLAVR